MYVDPEPVKITRELPDEDYHIYFMEIYDRGNNQIFKKELPASMNQATPFIEELYEATVKHIDLRDEAMEQLAQNCK